MFIPMSDCHWHRQSLLRRLLHYILHEHTMILVVNVIVVGCRYDSFFPFHFQSHPNWKSTFTFGILVSKKNVTSYIHSFDIVSKVPKGKSSFYLFNSIFFRMGTVRFGCASVLCQPFVCQTRRKSMNFKQQSMHSISHSVSLLP